MSDTSTTVTIKPPAELDDEADPVPPVGRDPSAREWFRGAAPSDEPAWKGGAKVGMK